jgi:hypothetical protein
MALFTSSLEVESKFCGLVIGRGRSGLRKLAVMPGVVEVRFRPERRNPSPPPSTTLTVLANSQEACLAVLNKVSLCFKSRKLANYPVVHVLP